MPGYPQAFRDCLWITFALLVFIGCRPQEPVMHRQTRVMMGTFVEVVSPDPRAGDIAFKEIGRVENLLSKYKPDSEIAQLNKLGRLKVSPATWFILTKAKEFWYATDGAFDITVGPLMDIWGFTGKQFRIPSDGEITAARQSIGANKIIFHEANSVVELGIPGMKIDLGAVAKGYAVDCAVQALRAAGISSALINAGGQIYCLGVRSSTPWRVAIRDPRGKGTSKSVDMTDKAIATSGDYEQYFIVGGRRYAHIMDPKTGYPSESGVVAVTVIADDGLTADFLSTAIFVLGKTKGLALVKRFPGARVTIEGPHEPD
ncbi:MAG TPA: FAD:protein FMN transferase [Candidatus Omnitrophota bacterium]|nr:FAD:protein FMN transferase [Candidatus Omnitrophota bacterium]HRZ14889.1 FAD:protein FMN transferase [Candidatus Omnitrophota bacterium]